MRSSLSLLSLFALLASGVGCAPSNPGLAIDGVMASPMGGMCTYEATSNTFLGSGTLDTLEVGATFGPRYLAYVRVANHLINLFNDRYPVRADPNVMHLLAADIFITNIDGSTTSFGGLPNPFRVAAGGTVASAASESPGLGITSIEIIPAAYAAALAPSVGPDGIRIIASIRVIGRTTGDAAVQSAEYFFPIDVCSGCLYTCAATDDDVGGGGCLFGQDSSFALPPGTVFPDGTMCPLPPP